MHDTRIHVNSPASGYTSHVTERDYDEAVSRENPGQAEGGLMTSIDVVCSLVPHWWWCSDIDVST